MDRSVMDFYGYHGSPAAVWGLQTMDSVNLRLVNCSVCFTVLICWVGERTCLPWSYRRTCREGETEAEPGPQAPMAFDSMKPVSA